MATDEKDFLLFDELLKEEERITRDTVREFVNKQVLPDIADYFERGEFPMHLIPIMGEMGLFGVTLPEKYGCSDSSYVIYGLIQQGPDAEICNPTVVLTAELPGAVDARLPEDDSPHPVDARVVPDILVGRTLATTVGRGTVPVADSPGLWYTGNHEGTSASGQIVKHPARPGGCVPGLSVWLPGPGRPRPNERL